MLKGIVDADSLIYKVGFAFEETIEWDNEPTIYGNLQQCKKTIDSTLESIKLRTGCEELELHLTGSDNFRHEVVDDYKNNRTGLRKPTDFSGVREYLVTRYNAIVHNGYEADDVVCMLKREDSELMLIAIDKDVLMQSVGTHYNYGKDEFITVTEEEAVRFKYYQALAGDPVDGYKGVPGIGPKKAEKILAECSNEKEYWEATVKAYEDKELTEQDAINTMRLADMHQLTKDYTVVLWEPLT